MYKKLVAEFVGTFFLVFIGTGAVVVSEQFNGSIGGFGISLSFGLIVTVMILVFGKHSGAHFNPAVTVAFYMANLFQRQLIIAYAVAQCFGAITASLVLHFLFPSNKNLGSTLPRSSNTESFIYEFLLTFVLMAVILIFSQGKLRLQKLAPYAIGFTVFLEAYFAGAICGASMNPARSIGPAIVSGNMNVLWIYIVATILGALTAVFALWKYLKKAIV